MARVNEAGATARNFHVPLPERLYEELKMESEQTQRSASALVREAVEVWLEQRRQERLDQAIGEYVAAVAGTSADLDPDLEAAGLELIRDDT